MNEMELSWTNDIEHILECIRANSFKFSSLHKNKYFVHKSLQKYFRIPTIVLSAVSSVASVGLNTYLKQNHISALTCGLALIVGIINSIELYLKIQENLEIELTTSKDFYTLAIEIEKTLNLNRENRKTKGSDFLEKKFTIFIQLVENANLIDKTGVTTALTKVENKKPKILQVLNRLKFNEENKKEKNTEKNVIEKNNTEKNVIEKNNTEKNIEISNIINRQSVTEPRKIEYNENII